MSKRVLSLVLALVMVLGTFGTVFAAESGNAKVDWLVEEGLVVGDAGTGDLRLADPIKRSEVAVMVTKALDLETVALASAAFPSIFKDMSPAHWANGFVNTAAGRGFISGYPNGNFVPENPVNYAEMASMLVRTIPGAITAEEQANAVWPTTWLAKAAELGLFDGVAVADFNAAATRENVFNMVYNAVINKQAGNYAIVKGIVLENNRVESISKDEVVVEIIKELQTSSYADASRKEKGDQIAFAIPAKVADVEGLLGKVVDFTLDKDDNVVAVKEDTTYKVVEGPVVAGKNKLTVAGKDYTVELDERYRGTDERVFRTYHNDKPLKYEDFYSNTKEADYAKVTIKNGKVLFIDSFTFDDIAPVQEVKRDGLDVYVYNDYRDARVEKFEPRSLVLGYKDGEFARIERSDIKANDVVHVYSGNRMIVRQDALVEGEYQKVQRDRFGDYYAHIDDEAYLINDVDYRRPVYAHDSKAYTTLFAKYAQNDLANFYKEEVVALVDINGDLQLFGADVQYNEGMAIIEQILARGQVKFVQPDDERLILDETYSSDISIYKLGDKKTTTNQRLNNFNKFDLTFVLGNEEDIDTLVRIADRDEMEEAAQALLTTKAVDMNNSFIRVVRGEGNYRYQVLDRTNVFVIDAKGNISGTTVAKLQASLKADSAIEVFVLSDEEISELIADEVISDRNRITEKEDIAHTLVFFAPDYADAKTDGETVLVTNVYTARTPHYVVGQRPDSEGKGSVERTADKGVNFRTLNTNDIVSLKLTKDDDKLVKDWDVLIAADKVKTESYRVIGGDIGREYSRYEFRRLVLEDANEVKYEYWLVRNAEEFGTITVDSVVTFHEDGNGDIDVIRVYKASTAVTANADLAPIKTATYTIENALYLDSNNYVKLDDGKTYPYAGDIDLDGLKGLIGDEVVVTFETIRGEVVITLIQLLDEALLEDVKAKVGTGIELKDQDVDGAVKNVLKGYEVVDLDRDNPRSYKITSDKTNITVKFSYTLPSGSTAGKITIVE